MQPDQSTRPCILVCNDDGIDASGIAALAAAMVTLGDVYVIAPVEEQSAVGHAISMRTPVRARPWPFEIPGGNVQFAYAVGGTPADCVKIAVDKLIPRRPDIVVSGINHGANTAVNVLYSGTVSAATEASILGLPAVAFSLCGYRHGSDFGPAADVAISVVRAVLCSGLPPGVLLNVNVPAVTSSEIVGAMITRQARARWEEEFVERFDPSNERYYWLSGRFVDLDTGSNTDLWAVANNYVSITPLHHDLTANDAVAELSRVDWL
jgi:5'-nucleotidase